MRVVLIVTLVAATVLYPFIIYYWLNAFGVLPLAMLLFLLLLGRVIIRGNYQQPEQYVQLLLVGSLCLLAAWFNSEAMLRYYPVLMSLGFAGFFAISLTTDVSLIERFTHMISKEAQPPKAIAYMRNLTLVWAVFLVVNAGIAWYTACCMSMGQWALYNGFIAYILMGVFMLAEMVFRHFYRKKHAVEKV